MGEVAGGAARSPRELHARGVRRGDVVLTLLGNRPEWVLTMLACFRQGYVVLPCTEQLRANDLRLRLDVARPALVVCDERNAEALARRRLERADALGARDEPPAARLRRRPPSSRPRIRA